MANMRPFIIAIAFALIAVALVYVYIQQVQQPPSAVEMATVVRATQNIAPKTTITEDMLEEYQILQDQVTPDTITELDEVLGKVSATSIYADQVLITPMFKARDEFQNIALMLEEGERAVTVGVTEVSGLGGNLQPGDHVDVMVSILDNKEVGVASSFTVLKNIEVMAVGQNIGFENADEAEAQVSKSVTLNVKPIEAERLALASEVGSLRLALRYPEDIYSPETGGTPLTQFTIYTPTRDDKESAAKQAKEDADAASEREYQRRMAEWEARARMAESGVNPNDYNGPETLPPLTPPGYTVDLYLGGVYEKVEVGKEEE